MISEFISLVFPQVCITCRTILVSQEEDLCISCLFDLPLNDNSDLFKEEMQQKFLGRVALTHAFAFLKFQKMGSTQAILHHIKYKGAEGFARKLGARFGETLFDKIDGRVDFIVPIPLHKSKLMKRGFNQSEMFALGIGGALKVDVHTDIIRRAKHTETQTRKSKHERWQNVEGIFEVPNPDKIIGKRILVVDDVITTGATLENCLLELNKAGAKELSIACLAAAQ